MSPRSTARLIAVLLLPPAAVLVGVVWRGYFSGGESVQRWVGLRAARMDAAQLATWIAVGSLIAIAVRGRWRGRAGWTALALGGLSAVGLAHGLELVAMERFTGMQVQRHVVLAVPSAPDAWEVVRGREDAPPRADWLTPSANPRQDGLSLPSLVLPPPAVVSITAPRVDPLGATLVHPLRLRLRAGIAPELIELADRMAARPSVRFTVRVDGEVVWEELVEAAPEPRFKGCNWRDVRGADGALGLVVPVGGRVELSTALLDGRAQETVSPRAFDVGFGSVVFERHRKQRIQPVDAQSPSVVMIVMDTLRADRTSAYGYKRPTTPALERLAERGLLVEEARSPSSWTWPATASLLTGRLPAEHGVLDESSSFLGYELETLAEAFSRAGWRTAAWSSNPLIVPGKNFDQGFAEFSGPSGYVIETGQWFGEALDWLDTHAGERFFLYLHLADPHVPHLPMPEARELFAPDVPEDLQAYRLRALDRLLRNGSGRDAAGVLDLDSVVSPEERQWLDDLYDACVWSGDARLGQLLDKLAALELTDQTLVAFTSDHGEDLFEHGFATHSQALHRGLVHVPLVLAGPGVPRGVRFSTALSTRHLAPTLARLAGVPFDAAPDAIDLVRASASSEPERDALLFHTSAGWWEGNDRTDIWALERDQFVLHWAPAAAAAATPGSDKPNFALRLYDRSNDPGEQLDVADRRPQDVARLKRELEALRELYSSRRKTTAQSGAGADTLEMLRGLGYIGDDE